MHNIVMPKLGFTMTTGIIQKWFKQEGDIVNRGDKLFEIMTDKVTFEVESFHSGILKEILKKEGEEVPVRETIAYIIGEDEV